MTQLKAKLHKLYADRTGTPVDRFVELMERDRWLEAKEAQELGLISKVVNSRADLESLVAK
jgi:ATP-dependent Clp protease protease subunit